MIVSFGVINVNAKSVINKIDIKTLYNEARALNKKNNNIMGVLSNENGESVNVDMYEVYEMSRVSNNENEYTITCVYALDSSMFGKNTEIINPRGTGTITEDDGTYVYGTLSVTYNKINATGGYQDRYLLTKVSGEWDVRTYQISLSDKRVAYTCQSLQNLGTTDYKYPTSNTFTYNTGFSQYVEDVYGTWVAAQMNVVCKRGLGSWDFDVFYYVVDKPVSSGDFW